MREDVEETIRESGQDFEIRGVNGLSRARGIKNGDDRTVLFPSEVRMRAGDWIVDELGTEYMVEDVTRLSDEGRPLALQVHYKTKAQHEAEQRASRPSDSGVSNVFNIEYAPGSVIGTHNNAELTNTFDFRAIEQRIELEGGDDKEELRRALARVERLIERGGYVDRGALSEFSGAMERHSWFTGAVAQALIGFATQASGG